ncbi:MAG: hypothetical protein AAFX06_15380 [Planctomycetota bacterium]
MTENFLTRPFFAFGLLFALGSSALGSITFSDDFSSGTLNSNLQQSSSGAYSIANGVIQRSGGGSQSVRTSNSNYTDFTYELTTVFPTSGFDVVHIGVGQGTPDTVGSMYLRYHTPGYANGRVDVRFRNGAGVETLTQTGLLGLTQFNAPVRSRIARVGDLLTFEVDQNFNGTFVADASTSFDLSLAQFQQIRTALDNQSSLYFSNAESTTTFDDLNIIGTTTAAVPEPGSLLAWGMMATVLLPRRKRS